MWSGIAQSSREGRGMTVEQFREYVHGLSFPSWRPSFGCFHNTAAPTLAQWKGYPAAQRILNLERYYRDEQGWSAGPHAFVAHDFIWPFTPLNMRGTHTPSWNGTAFGIEMVGNYTLSGDDPTTGDGLAVYRNMVAVFAILYAKLGLDPATIKFHREDPRTTHRCPGDRMFALKPRFIADVQEFMGAAGDHVPEDDGTADPKPKPDAPPEGTVIASDGLNLRAASSASSQIIVLLPEGQRVAILGEAMNGATQWLRVWCRTPDGAAHAGWVAARYVQRD
jgi:hypothetical protein